MERKYILVHKHVKAGETVSNGYSNGICTAPLSPGLYSLYEVADGHNCHVGWVWRLEATE